MTDHTSRREKIIKDFRDLTPDIFKGADQEVDLQEQDPKTQLDKLLVETAAFGYMASIFDKRHEDAKTALTKSFALYVLVTKYPELFAYLVSILMARGRKRKPSVEMLALVVLQVVTNAWDEAASKLCSKQAPILKYAAKQNITVEHFPHWLETMTAAKARAAMKNRTNADKSTDDKRRIARLQNLAMTTGHIIVSCPTEDMTSKLQSFSPGQQTIVVEIGQSQENGFVPIKAIKFGRCDTEPEKCTAN